MLFAWIDHRSLGLRSYYMFQNLCHFVLLIHFEKSHYVLQKVSVSEFIQNNMAYMLDASIDHPM